MIMELDSQEKKRVWLNENYRKERQFNLYS